MEEARKMFELRNEQLLKQKEKLFRTGDVT